MNRDQQAVAMLLGRQKCERQAFITADAAARHRKIAAGAIDAAPDAAHEMLQAAHGAAGEFQPAVAGHGGPQVIPAGMVAQVITRHGTAIAEQRQTLRLVVKKIRGMTGEAHDFIRVIYSE